MKRTPGSLLTLLLILCFLASCGGSGGSGNTPSGDDDDQALIDLVNPNSDLDGDGIRNADDTDIDGDGLSNTDEDRYGTSAYIEDTDGDGWTDNEELERFVVAENIFNPAVADLPRIELILKSEPLVKMAYETTSGKSVDYATSTSDTFEATRTTSNSFAHTFGTEHGWSVETGIEIGGTGGSPHAVWHLNLGAHGTYTTEDTHEWGVEESYTHARTVESARSISTSEDLTQTGGSITYSVAFKNTGSMAYIVDTLELAAYKTDRNDPELIGSISQSSNSSFSEFQSFQLNPGQESGIFSFRNDSLYVSDVMSLLEDASGIICSIAGYTVSMDGVDFTQSGTDVPAKTAKIFIDYGPGVDKPSEQYSVATKTNINVNATTLFDLYHPVLLKDLLASINIPYDLGYEHPETQASNNGLVSVKGVAHNDEYQKYWYVAHIYKEDNTDMIALYAAHMSDYDFDEISVNTGDTVQLIYSVDGDGDGIPLRIEKMLGTSDNLLDSDGDTLSDWDELHPDPETAPKTNPANKDTDGDGLLDPDDDDPLVARISDDATLVDLQLSVGSIDFVADPTDGGGVQVRDYTVTDVVADSIRITPYAAKNACPIVVRVNGEAAIDLSSDTASPELPLVVGDNTLVITVTALDGVTQETYTLNIDSKLAPVTDFLAYPVSDEEIELGWTVPDDNRISGLIIRRYERTGTTEMVDATPGPHDYEVGDELPLHSDVWVVYDLDRSASQQRDVGLRNHTTYDYEIFTFHKNGAVYAYSDGTRVTSATNARTRARLHFRLYYLKAIEDRDGIGFQDKRTEYYWDINVNNEFTLAELLYDHVSLNADDPLEQFYAFNPGVITSMETDQYVETSVVVNRDDHRTVTLNVHIYEHDGGAVDDPVYLYDRGEGDDDIIHNQPYTFTYDFETDTWSCAAEALTITAIGPGEAVVDEVLQIRDNHGDCDLKVGFWWEELHD